MINTTHRALLKRIEQLKKEAEIERVKETRAAILQIRKTMEDFGITLAELGAINKATRAKRKSGKSNKPKYQDPQTGLTWTGRGSAPGWIVGKDRSKYAI